MLESAHLLKPREARRRLFPLSRSSNSCRSHSVDGGVTLLSGLTAAFDQMVSIRHAIEGGYHSIPTTFAAVVVYNCPKRMAVKRLQQVGFVGMVWVSTRRPAW